MMSGFKTLIGKPLATKQFSRSMGGECWNGGWKSRAEVVDCNRWDRQDEQQVDHSGCIKFVELFDQVSDHQHFKYRQMGRLYTSMGEFVSSHFSHKATSFYLLLTRTETGFNKFFSVLVNSTS
jgi:hypothetical protein